MKKLKAKNSEALSSILPISAIVLVLSVTIAPLGNGILTVFLFGTLFLILGMGLFSLGSEMSMQPLGEGMGSGLGKSKHIIIPLAVCLLLGAIVTVAEPDLQVLAKQIPSISDNTLIFSVAAGVGIFLMIAMLRAVFNIKLTVLLFIFYPIIILLSFFAPADFIPAAFDSGGVTTGPITVPFIMALGAGIAAVGKSKKSGEEGFGLISLCSIGPILSVLILSIFFKPSASSAPTVITEATTTREAFLMLMNAIPGYAREVLIAMAPIIIIFIIFEIVTRRWKKHQLSRICVGLFYTYIGLVLFLSGANAGFMPAGSLLGSAIAKSSHKWLLIPVGMVIGYFVVAAEPAVAVLRRQVEEISNGTISQRSVQLALSIGVSLSVGISMLRVITGISLFPFIIGGYVIALVLSFFVPGLFTGVAFDSGGVASGPMTTAFILPFAVGACEALGGNVMTDAFGIVAMVAMTPLITLQGLGLAGRIRTRMALKRANEELGKYDDCIIYFDTKEVSV